MAPRTHLLHSSQQLWDLYPKRKQKQMSGKTWNKKSERREKSCRKILSDGWSHSPSSTVLIVSFTECIPLWLDQAIHILLENYLSELMILIWRNLLVRSSWKLCRFHVKIDSNLTNFRKSWNLPWSLDRSQYFQETCEETILENIVLFGNDNCHSSVVILHSKSEKFSNANLCLFFEANGWPNAWDSMPRNVCLHFGIKD